MLATGSYHLVIEKFLFYFISLSFQVSFLFVVVALNTHPYTYTCKKKKKSKGKEVKIGILHIHTYCRYGGARVYTHNGTFAIENIDCLVNIPLLHEIIMYPLLFVTVSFSVFNKIEKRKVFIFVYIFLIVSLVVWLTISFHVSYMLLFHR